MKLEIESDALGAVCSRVKPEAVPGSGLYREAGLEQLNVIADSCNGNPACISATVIRFRSRREGVATHIAIKLPV